MADDRFDDLTKKLAGPQSRRTMLRTLVAAAVGGALLPASALAAREEKSKSSTCLKKGSFCSTKSGSKKCCSHMKCHKSGSGKHTTHHCK